MKSDQCKGTARLLGAIGICYSLGTVMVGCSRVSTVVSGATDDFLATGRTLSHFTAIQVDPRSEDSAGPQFVSAGDVNGDGLIDLVSAWNQSQPVQIHLQRRTETGAIRFETLTLAGNIPVVSVAGLAMADFDNDSRMDIAVLIKNTAGTGGGCLDSEVPEGGLTGLILIYLGPEDATQTNQALAWREVQVGASILQGTGSGAGPPELDGFTEMAVGDIDRNGTMDIVVAWNTDCGEGSTDVVVFNNLGPTEVRDGTWTGLAIPDSFVKGTLIKSVSLGDVDGDGDLDIVATFPDSRAMNVRWFRNPALDTPDEGHISDGAWQVGTIAQVATGADVVRVAEIDGDGIVDVLVRSTTGGVIQWLKGPVTPTTAPIRSIPWQVFTLSEFTDRTPEAMAVGDLNFDGQQEIIVSAQGALAWFDSGGSSTVFDKWTERLIVDDSPVSDAATDPNVDPGEAASTTVINSILVVDLDGDGANDIVATFDRTGLSGLTDDALVWFRNTRSAP